jgi:hypothetical protein
VLLVG